MILRNHLHFVHQVPHIKHSWILVNYSFLPELWKFSPEVSHWWVYDVLLQNWIFPFFSCFTFAPTPLIQRFPTQSIKLRVHSIGAHVATVSWEPPPVKYRNGQLIVYRINISCEDWLRSRHIMVQNKLSQLIQGMLFSYFVFVLKFTK